jgi:DNA polymerase IV
MAVRMVMARFLADVSAMGNEFSPAPRCLAAPTDTAYDRLCSSNVRPAMAANDPRHGFCRDCLLPQDSESRRCVACGSPRLARHGELYSLSLAHVDCDAFYAAVEKRDRPELRDRPVIIGGGRRGVVSTACYIARISGVRSAMPMFKALKACPEAVVIKPDMDKYVHVGRQVRAMMQALTPLVEPISIDEAFLDLAGTERLHGRPPALVLAEFARRVETEIGISVSVGLSYCKFLAKVASDLEKPRGFSVIGEAEARSFLADKPVTLIWGVGKAFAETLARDGIRTIGQLQTMERNDLMRRYGTMGDRLHSLANGEDARRVHVDREARSVSAETTFDTDLSRAEDLVPVLRALSEKVSARLKKSGIAGRTIVLKLKTREFRIRTRNRQLPDATRLADRIFSVGRELLARELDGTQFRLLGIGVADLTDAGAADPPDLVDPSSSKRALAEGAMDRVREKFGRSALETGYTFGRGHRGRPASQEDETGPEVRHPWERN